MDDTPIAILQDNKVYYIYADHLNTPRRVATNDTNQIVWKWDSKPFGEDKPTGTYTLNLRFPGQYFDKESGFSYNFNRYYNPKLGRYMQSDPIGLDGGENSFVYVGDNPLIKIDAEGLWNAFEEVQPNYTSAPDAQDISNWNDSVKRSTTYKFAYKFDGLYFHGFIGNYVVGIGGTILTGKYEDYQTGNKGYFRSYGWATGIDISSGWLEGVITVKNAIKYFHGSSSSVSVGFKNFSAGLIIDKHLKVLGSYAVVVKGTDIPVSVSFSVTKTEISKSINGPYN